MRLALGLLWVSRVAKALVNHLFRTIVSDWQKGLGGPGTD